MGRRRTDSRELLTRSSMNRLISILFHPRSSLSGTLSDGGHPFRSFIIMRGVMSGLFSPANNGHLMRKVLLLLLLIVLLVFRRLLVLEVENSFNFPICRKRHSTRNGLAALLLLLSSSSSYQWTVISGAPSPHVIEGEEEVEEEERRTLVAKP